jgi:hypothetical protein
MEIRIGKPSKILEKHHANSQRIYGFKFLLSATKTAKENIMDKFAECNPIAENLWL